MVAAEAVADETVFPEPLVVGDGGGLFTTTTGGGGSFTTATEGGGGSKNPGVETRPPTGSAALATGAIKLFPGRPPMFAGLLPTGPKDPDVPAPAPNRLPPVFDILPAETADVLTLGLLGPMLAACEPAAG